MLQCIPGETVVCIHIALTEGLTGLAVWDPDEVRIRVASDAPVRDVLRELRDILIIDLGAPTTRCGQLRCFCGMRVELPEELLLRCPAAEAG